MSRKTFEEEVKIRDAVKEYIRKHGMTSLRKIAAYVLNETGIETTPTTIRRLVISMGYQTTDSEWEKVKK